MKKTIYLFIIMMLQVVIGGTVSAQVLRNSSNSQIGKIESGGIIRDASNRQIGRVEGSSFNKFHVAAVYFFFFFN